MLGSLVCLAAQTDNSSPISPNLTDAQLVEFSKAEPTFAATAVEIVQGRICVYAEAAKTFRGQPFVSEVRKGPAVVPPRSLCLTNAISAARLYLDFTTPANLNAGAEAVAWTELGFAVLERVNSVLHHYYLALEYRKGHEVSIRQLRQAARELAVYLQNRGGNYADELADINARFATLWFEKAEEVIPVYRALIGTGARGTVRNALVLRPVDLPLVAGWTWEERKRAEVVQKELIQELLTSTNAGARVEGMLINLARARTDRPFHTAFTNALEGIDVVAKRVATRTAYADVIRDLLEDRHSRTLSDKTRNELRGLYEARFIASGQVQTNAVNQTNIVAVTTNKPAPAKLTATPPEGRAPASPVNAVAKLRERRKAPLSWQELHSASDIRYWETMPISEIRGLAAGGDVIANYYVFLKLRDSDKPDVAREANAALLRAVEAEFPPAELAYANRLAAADERFHYTKKAADTGFPAAKLALGKLYIIGYGTPIELELGLSLVRGAYDVRVPEAEPVLAELYASGLGQPRSINERPEKLFLTAARNNQPAAMWELHQRYLHGYAVVRDHLEASRWLVNVGLHDKSALENYLDDLGQARTQPTADMDRFAKTLAVYAQAVIHKQPEAINRVAEWYETGSVGRKSSVRAYALLSLAAPSQKIEPATIERARAALTPKELKTAELLVSQWQRIQPDLL